MHGVGQSPTPYPHQPTSIKYVWVYGVGMEANNTLVESDENQGGEEMCMVTGCGETHTPYVMDKVTLLCEEHAPENA